MTNPTKTPAERTREVVELSTVGEQTHMRPEPYGWYADTGQYGRSDGCSRPFQSYREAVAYAAKHDGYAFPLWRKPFDSPEVQQAIRFAKEHGL